MGNNNQLIGNIVMLVVIFAAFYFFLIRPQKNKDKQVQDMRNGLQVGDEIVTIGGICGKIVKTKPDTIVIQVGADRVKFEMMRWAVSSVTSTKNTAPVQEEEEPKKVTPKRLKKSDAEAEEEAPEEK